jgi:hypothetical protein
MIRRLDTRPVEPSPEMRQEVATLVALHGAQATLLIVRDRQRDALDNQHWLDGTEVRNRRRYWSSVMREIEQQSV